MIYKILRDYFEAKPETNPHLGLERKVEVALGFAVIVTCLCLAVLMGEPP